MIVQCQFDSVWSGRINLLKQVRSNPLAWWWYLLASASSGNVALWLLLYREFHNQPTGSLENASGIQLMLILCAAYVFGCAFRSVLPRADVQRICLFDTWLSSVAIGRSVATVAEICFAAQWAIALHQLARIAAVDTALCVAWAIVPLIVLAQCCSWYGVLTTNYLANAVENSIWAVTFLLVGIALCLLLPEFVGLVRSGLIVAIVGIAGYLAFLITIDVPMYVKRWQERLTESSNTLGPLEGLHDASTRWIVTHDLAEWKDEIAWMSLYFTAAVWASLALCFAYSFGEFLPRYRPEIPAHARVVEKHHIYARAAGLKRRTVIAHLGAAGPIAD